MSPLGELSDSGLELQAIIDALPAMVAYWDRGLRNHLANRAYIEWFGVAPEDMAGMHIAELLGPEVFAKNLPYIEGALAGEPQLFNRTLIDAAGRERLTQASYVPDVVDGEVRGFLVLVTDVSARVEVERELERRAELFRALARDMPNGFVLVFDRDLRFIVADGTALGDFGYGPRRLEGRTIFEAVPPELAAELAPRYLAALAGRTLTWERRRGGRTYSLTAGPVRERGGAVFAGMVSGTDVTVLRQNEAMNVALGQIATAVARQAAPASVVTEVTHSVRDLLAVESAAIVRFEPSGTATVLAAAPCAPAGLPPARAFAGGQGRHVRFADGAGAAIRVRDRLWGALVIGTTPGTGLDGDTLERLSPFADLVELTISNAEAWEALARDARTDALTGLANHRTFQERLHEEVAQAERHGGPLTLVLLDLDRFKAVNDTHGHQVGDAVLAELAARLRPLLREGELLARIGGEEFAWVLPGSTGEEAVEAAERIRREVGGRPFPVAGTVTISVGVSELASGCTAAGLIERADRALYAAKRGGRDRTCLDDAP